MLRLYFWWMSLGAFSVAVLGITSAWFGFHIPLLIQLLILGVPCAIAQFRIQSNPSQIEQRISDKIQRFDELWQHKLRTKVLKSLAKIREFIQRETRPKFHSDKRLAQMLCYLIAAILLFFGFKQAVFFWGSYKGFVYPIPYFLLSYILAAYDAENFSFDIAKKGMVFKIF